MFWDQAGNCLDTLTLPWCLPRLWGGGCHFQNHPIPINMIFHDVRWEVVFTDNDTLLAYTNTTQLPLGLHTWHFEEGADCANREVLISLHQHCNIIVCVLCHETFYVGSCCCTAPCPSPATSAAGTGAASARSWSVTTTSTVRTGQTGSGIMDQ